MRARAQPHTARGAPGEGRGPGLTSMEGLRHVGWLRPSPATFLPIPILLGLIPVAHSAFGPSIRYDPEWLILLGNTLGVTVVGLVVSYFALRNYEATGRLQVLLLGCGVLIFGIGGLVAAVVRSLPDGANLNVTIYNTGAVVGGAFHLVAAFLVLAGASPETSSRQRGRWLLLGYASSGLFMLVLTVASLAGALPRFFVQGVGPTPLRQAVLGAADLLFLFSFIVFLGSYLRTRDAFLYWYACALALTCISLTAFFVEHSVGSPVGWMGRFSQYVGGVYFFFALISAARAAEHRGTSLDTALAESLSGAEERFRALAENSPDAIHRFAPSLNQIYVNAAGQRLHGKPAAAVVGRRLEQAGIPPAQATALVAAIRRVFETGESVQVEIDLPGSEGTRSFESRCVAERGPRGEVANVMMLTRDITDRKRTEEALRASEERFRLLYENTSDGVWIHTLDGVIREVNDAYCKMSGYAREELEGMPISRLEVVESPGEVTEHIRKLVESGGHDRFESKHRRKDGSVFDVDITALYLDQDGGRIAVFTRDDTERKRVEEALREAESRYRELVRLAPAGIYEVDFRARRFTSVNDAMVEILGYSREELLAMSPLEILDEESRARFQTRLQRWLSGEKPDTDVEYRVRTRDGRTIDALLAVSFTADQEGKPLGATVVGYDISDRKRMEEAVRQSREALREANARLIDADRRKNEFLAMLSHELRNPLMPIANSLYILDHAPPGGEQADRAKRVIGRQVAHLSNLVNDLLDVTRITRSKVQLQKERLELNELVRRTVEDNRSFFERAGVRLDLVPAPRPIPVIADPTRLAQVVGNLLHNAAKFTHQGGHTRVLVAVEAGEAIVRVADDGAGITGETLARLFEPFMQADQTLDRSKGGLGLGLALVKGLVELHGGSVSAHSDGLGKGSEFIVRLPLAPDVALDSVAAGAAPTRARRRVLVIEDNIDAADSLREALEFCGHRVAVAYSGPDGIARAREFRPDVVLCDIGLPGMDGYEVARAFRDDETLQGTFLVALSGYALPEDLQRAAEAGFQRHLPKPPNVDDLEELLATTSPA